MKKGKTQKKIFSSVFKKSLNVILKKQKKSKKLYEKCVTKCDSIATLPEIKDIELKNELKGSLYATKKCKKVKPKKRKISHRKYFKCIDEKQKDFLNITKKYKDWDKCQRKKCSKEYDNYINIFK